MLTYTVRVANIKSNLYYGVSTYISVWEKFMKTGITFWVKKLFLNKEIKLYILI